MTKKKAAAHQVAAEKQADDHPSTPEVLLDYLHKEITRQLDEIKEAIEGDDSDVDEIEGLLDDAHDHIHDDLYGAVDNLLDAAKALGKLSMKTGIDEDPDDDEMPLPDDDPFLE